MNILMLPVGDEGVGEAPWAGRNYSSRTLVSILRNIPVVSIRKIDEDSVEFSFMNWNLQTIVCFEGSGRDGKYRVDEYSPGLSEKTLPNLIGELERSVNRVEVISSVLSSKVEINLIGDFGVVAFCEGFV